MTALEECIDLLIEDEQLLINHLMMIDKDKLLINMMYIRNNYKMWKPDSPIRLYFHSIGIFHADDMSQIVIEMLWSKVNNKEYNLIDEVKYYIKFWKKIGYTYEEMVEEHTEKEKELFIKAIKDIDI